MLGQPTIASGEREPEADAGDARQLIALARSLSDRGFPARARAVAIRLHERAWRQGDHLAVAESADCLAECCYMMARYEEAAGFAQTARD